MGASSASCFQWGQHIPFAGKFYSLGKQRAQMALTVPSQAPAVCQGWVWMICDHPGLCGWTGTSTQKWLQEELLTPKDSFGEPLLGCPLDHTAKVTHDVKR